MNETHNVDEGRTPPRPKGPTPRAGLRRSIPRNQATDVDMPGCGRKNSSISDSPPSGQKASSPYSPKSSGKERRSRSNDRTDRVTRSRSFYETDDEENYSSSMHEESFEKTEEKSSGSFSNKTSCKHVTITRTTSVERIANGTQISPSSRLRPVNSTRLGKPGLAASNSTQPTRKQKLRKNPNEETSFYDKKLYRLSAVIILSVVGYCSYHLYSQSSPPVSVARAEESRDTYRSLIDQVETGMQRVRLSFPEQKPSLWDHVIGGVIELIEHKRRPSIFLFFSNETERMTCLAESIANATRRLLGGKHFLRLTPENLGKDAGHVLESLQSRIERDKVVIVHDLLKIDSGAITAFHSYCDSENPVVREAVYLMTMTANGYRSSQQPVKFAEEKLRRSLSHGIDAETLDALISRITEGVVLPVERSRSPCNPLDVDY